MRLSLENNPFAFDPSVLFDAGQPFTHDKVQMLDFLVKSMYDQDLVVNCFSNDFLNAPGVLQVKQGAQQLTQNSKLHVQKTAHEILARLKELEGAWRFVDAILDKAELDQTKFFALQVLENAIKTRGGSGGRLSRV